MLLLFLFCFFFLVFVCVVPLWLASSKFPLQADPNDGSSPAAFNRFDFIALSSLAPASILRFHRATQRSLPLTPF